MIFRYARHTNKLKEIKHFYTSVLELSIIGSFNDHDGYDGVFLGKEKMNWHLEFTSTKEETNSIFNDDDILVLYPTSKSEYKNILSNIEKYKIKKHNPKNPYWKENGILIKDPDKFNIIISNQKM